MDDERRQRGPGRGPTCGPCWRRWRRLARRTVRSPAPLDRRSSASVRGCVGIEVRPRGHTEDLDAALDGRVGVSRGAGELPQLEQQRPLHPAVLVVAGVGHDRRQAAHAAGVPDGERLGDHPAHRGADDVGPVDLERVEEGGRIVGHVVDRVARLGEARRDGREHDALVPREPARRSPRTGRCPGCRSGSPGSLPWSAGRRSRAATRRAPRRAPSPAATARPRRAPSSYSIVSPLAMVVVAMGRHAIASSPATPCGRQPLRRRVAGYGRVRQHPLELALGRACAGTPRRPRRVGRPPVRMRAVPARRRWRRAAGWRCGGGPTAPAASRACGPSSRGAPDLRSSRPGRAARRSGPRPRRATAARPQRRRRQRRHLDQEAVAGHPGRRRRHGPGGGS